MSGRLLDQFATLAMKHIRCYGFPWGRLSRGDRGPGTQKGAWSSNSRGRESAGCPSAMRVDYLVQKVTLLDACALTDYQHVLTIMRSVVHGRLLDRDKGDESWDSQGAVRSGSRLGRYWPLV